jgi:hypothetical protein
MSLSVRRGSSTPIPLIAGFGLFVVAIVYLVAASFSRRAAPVFAPSPAERVRAAGWERTGDTLTIDATDSERWRYVSLTLGRVLTPPDTGAWELAIQRYRLRAPGSIQDLGDVRFATANAASPTTSHPAARSSNLDHWYRYNLLTHLLEPSGHVYAVRAGDKLWKLAIVSYYCPGLTAGCLTVAYAPSE